MRKFLVSLLVLLLIFSYLPQAAYSEQFSDAESTEEIVELVLFSEEIDGNIKLFSTNEIAEEKKVLALIPDDTIVELLDSTNLEPELGSPYIFIRYVEEDELKSDTNIYEGYVKAERAIEPLDAEKFRKQREEKDLVEEEIEEFEPTEITENTDEEPEDISMSVQDSKQELNVQQKKMTGFALKHPVAVYESTSRNSKVLKEYNYGHVLIYENYDASKDWYEATVYVSGVPKTGYIHVSDVGESKNISSVNGLALKNTTAVYSNTNRNASVLKSYPKGSKLIYRAHSKDWFSATVYVKGKKHTGYIHTKDVETAISDQKTLHGVGVSNLVKVYKSGSTSAATWKSYTYGNTLKYKTFTKDWYEATVIVKGKPEKGYIAKKDVGALNTQLASYAQKTQTNVYSGTSRNTSILKSYQIGSTLKYRAHNKDWFKATVYINGKPKIGYIHRTDVGPTKPATHQFGYGTKNPTTVYASTSRNAKKLKSYKQNSLLKYYPHNSSWYRATVIINGKAQTGYLHKNDVGNAIDVSFVDPLITYSHSVMIKDIKALQKAYPDLIQYKVVGKSEYGRDIYAVGLGKGKATTFINGSIHAREWISTSLNMYMIENYAKAYNTNKSIQGFNARSILNDTTIWFMPMVNPDGVTLQQQGLKAFPQKDHAKLRNMNKGSSNFKRWKANAKGVDINRNFSVDWNNQRPGSPTKPHYENFGGASPLSSSEAMTMVRFLNDIKPEMTINYHSSGRILFWGYKQTGSRKTRDLNYANTVKRMTGYSLVDPKNDSYGGGFLQFFTETYKGPSLTPELTPYQGETNPSPRAQFPRVWQENQAVGLYAAQESAKLFKNK